MICKKCGLEKDVDEFRSRKKNNGEIYKINWCKHCENNRYTKICSNCNAKYTTKHNKSMYCCGECSAKGRRKGESVECCNCKKTVYRKPYRLNRAEHYYCSEECQRKHRGSWFNSDKIYNFNPLRTRELRQLERKTQKDAMFIRNVKKRDKFICNCCNKKGYVVAHHLESFNSNIPLRYDINNGITLCDECHKEFHKAYGYGNNTRKQYEEFKAKR